MNDENSNSGVTSPEERKLFWIMVVLAIICILFTADYTKVCRFIVDLALSPTI